MTMDEHGYRERLQACLDERRDPLDDAVLCDWLLEHPEHLEELARLRETLAVLESADPAPATLAPPSDRRGGIGRGWKRVAAVAAVLALCVFGWRLLELSAPPPRTEEEVPLVGIVPPGRVLDYRMSVVVERPSERVATTSSASGRTRSRTYDHGSSRLEVVTEERRIVSAR